MEEKKQLIQLTCKQEGCGKKFKIMLPKKAGAYQVKCPDGHINRIKFAAPNNHPDKESSSSMAETPGNVVTCPWGCGGKFKFETNNDGTKACTCPHCNGAINITVKEKSIVCVEKKQTTPICPKEATGKGKLTLVRFKGFLNKVASKSYPLHLGMNTIGRYDENLRCDIEIHNDSHASRRSVVIEVIDKNPGTLYRMSVLKATNPVMHNNKPLTSGEVVYLNYGDSIQVGKTLFNFEKA